MILKKFRLWVYGVYFVIKTDIYVLIIQLNRSGTDISGVLIIRWLAWIRLFDFNIRYVFGYKYITVNEFSRRSSTEIDNIRIEIEQSIDDFIDIYQTLSALPR